MMSVARAIFGICCLVAIAWAFSINRKKIDWKLVVAGMALQAVVGYMILNTEWLNV
ncbi:MAG: NupC/NupG family nucleoside CNT transporter, partial [Cytophagales bacterium]|nr:NupC/NupG family nucleoside CNT transporter [Cytophagales bacterium]